ncbi:unnamed protein product, partial [Mesorhabditis spiculigera]
MGATCGRDTINRLPLILFATFIDYGHFESPDSLARKLQCFKSNGYYQLQLQGNDIEKGKLGGFLCDVDDFLVKNKGILLNLIEKALAKKMGAGNEDLRAISIQKPASWEKGPEAVAYQEPH